MKIMEKPVEPNAEDCCNSGCNPCIFDIYEKQLALYNKYLESGQIDNPTSQDNGLSQLKYTTFFVVENKTLCNLHKLITFTKGTTNNSKVWWKPGDHFLFKYCGAETTCTRAYTPVKVEHRDTYDFAIIVKEYNNGLVSSSLCSLNKGDTTLWRGPYGHYNLQPNLYEKIFMIAQGTGIAPFITIIEHILRNDDNNTKVLLLYCTECDDTILFRDNLYTFQSFWNFKYEVFLSSTSTDFKLKYQEPIRKHKLSTEYLSNLKPSLGKNQFLMCGSPMFNTVYEDHLKNISGIDKNYIVMLYGLVLITISCLNLFILLNSPIQVKGHFQNKKEIL